MTLQSLDFDLFRLENAIFRGVHDKFKIIWSKVYYVYEILQRSENFALNTGFYVYKMWLFPCIVAMRVYIVL